MKFKKNMYFLSDIMKFLCNLLRYLCYRKYCLKKMLHPLKKSCIKYYYKLIKISNKIFSG